MAISACFSGSNDDLRLVIQPYLAPEIYNDSSMPASTPFSKRSTRSRAQVVRRVCESLECRYGRPRLGNPRRPVDDLVFIVLSNKTAAPLAKQTYHDLKRRFATWDDLLDAPARDVQRTIGVAGFGSKRTRQIRGALRKIRADFGSCSLAPLRRLPVPEAESYMSQLPGVSTKVAKCVLMYTMGAQVLPVDAHVHRVATRLGWTIRRRSDQCHEELERLVPPHRRFAFHVDGIVHARLICRPSNPRCDDCCIRRFCYFGGPAK